MSWSGTVTETGSLSPLMSGHPQLTQAVCVKSLRVTAFFQRIFLYQCWFWQCIFCFFRYRADWKHLSLLDLPSAKDSGVQRARIRSCKVDHDQQDWQVTKVVSWRWFIEGDRHCAESIIRLTKMQCKVLVLFDTHFGKEIWLIYSILVSFLSMMGKMQSLWMLTVSWSKICYSGSKRLMKLSSISWVCIVYLSWCL